MVTIHKGWGGWYTQGKQQNAHIWLEKLWGTDHLEDLAIHGKTIFNSEIDILKMVGCEDMNWTQVTQSLHEHDDEPWNQEIYWNE